MDVDPPKQMMTWPGYVGDLFDVAAGIVDDQGREKVKSEPIEERPRSKTHEQPSTALWPKRAWQTITAAIWGTRLSNSKFVYEFGVPHATIAVVVEQFKSVVGVFGSPDAEPANKQQFIDHAKIKRRISLKTLAKVLVQLSAKPKSQSAGEAMQMVEALVQQVHEEPTNEMDIPNPRKRRFEEIESDNVEVKSERSMSSGSSLSGTTNNSSVDPVKMEFEPTNTVDEETSNAASILNGVALDRRTVENIHPQMHLPTYWSQAHQQKGPPTPYPNTNANTWLYNSASSETFR